jgi:lipopolysaccharide transport system ATP-binding protein
MQAIVAENISKKYVIDHQKGGKKILTFRESIIENVGGLFGKSKSEGTDHEDFWALKDVSFEINKGDRVGIVGHNGAGKSTLLKILSRITEPTSGRISINGRIASLLEVGTGFHPELTGRENIFLNGAILGMKRNEIRDAFDQIIDFAGVEKFLDTPVKRYSSGMYVRLGFAIAAHLSPEILIVDEVLAVGDADFQKKCLGRMRDVSESGRTILFVSHNLTAIQSLCNRAFFFEKGQMLLQGETNQVVAHYLSHIAKNVLLRQWESPTEAPGNDQVRLKHLQLIPDYQGDLQHIDIRTPMQVKIEFWNRIEDDAILNVSLHLMAFTGECVFNSGTQPQPFARGLISATLNIPGDFLNDGSYIVSVMIVQDTSTILYQMSDALSFDIEDYREGYSTWHGKWPGYVRPRFDFEISQAEIIV